jgi:hypothetical protein
MEELLMRKDGGGNWPMTRNVILASVLIFVLIQVVAMSPKAHAFIGWTAIFSPFIIAFAVLVTGPSARSKPKPTRGTKERRAA